MTVPLRFHPPGPSAPPLPPGAAPTVAVTHGERSALLEDLRARLVRGGAGNGAGGTEAGFRLATLNLDHLVKLRGPAAGTAGAAGTEAGAFRAAYAAQSHVVADGNPIVWLHRLAGRRIALIPGSELVDPLCALAAQTGAPVALLGSTAPVLATAARRLEAAHPGLRVALRHAPAMGFEPEGAAAEAAVAALEAAQAAEGRPGLCFLALGAPRQERFAAFAAPRLPGWGFASVGAGVDFVAGHQRRAPPWARRLAVEWLWRAASDPRRLAGRYAACAAILPGLAAQALAARARHRPRARGPAATGAGRT